MVTVVRGDVILCDLNPVIGTEQAGVRPALVVQIDRANIVIVLLSIAPGVILWLRHKLKRKPQAASSPELAKVGK